MIKIVRVEPRDVLATGRLQTAIAVCRDTDSIRLAKITDAWIGNASDYLFGVIGRVVIVNDDLEIIHCLSERALDRLAHVAAVVMGRNTDTNFRISTCHADLFDST